MEKTFIISFHSLILAEVSLDFIGSGYTFENLTLIPKDKLIKLPSNRKQILNDLFEGIEDSIYPKDYQEKTIEMISERWKLYEVFRNKK